MPVFALYQYMLVHGMIKPTKGNGETERQSRADRGSNESLDMIGHTIGCEGNTIRVWVISKYSARYPENRITEGACHVARAAEQKSMY